MEGAGHNPEGDGDKGVAHVGDQGKPIEGPIRRSPNLEGFNETLYITSGRRHTDSYKLNAFNQAESDKLKSDRNVPDSRHYR